MATLPRLFWSTVLCLSAVCVHAADARKETSPAPAAAPTATLQIDNLEFSGVSTLGKKTMINLFEKVEKRSFWVEVGASSSGVAVTNYDGAHDQVTVRVNGREKLLPLRAASAVVDGPASGVPAAPALPTASTGAAVAPTPTATTSMSQARQEEEARMLVSDLLEIGMAQRKAYEEAQRRAAAGQAQSAPAPAGDQASQTPASAPTSSAQASGGQSTQPTGSTTPSR